MHHMDADKAYGEKAWQELPRNATGCIYMCVCVCLCVCVITIEDNENFLMLIALFVFSKAIVVCEVVS